MDGKHEESVLQDLDAQLQRVGGSELGPRTVVCGSDKMDYAVISFAQPGSATTLVERTRASPLVLGGHQLHVQAGGWKAIVGLVAAQEVLTRHFVSCPNPRPCRGLIYLGLKSGAGAEEVGAATVHCRRCDYAFCGACRLADHSPVPCKVLRDWEGEGGSSLQSRDDLETKKLVYDITKKCPKCATAIEKNGEGPPCACWGREGEGSGQ